VDRKIALAVETFQKYRKMPFMEQAGLMLRAA